MKKIVLLYFFAVIIVGCGATPPKTPIKQEPLKPLLKDQIFKYSADADSNNIWLAGVECAVNFYSVVNVEKQFSYKDDANRAFSLAIVVTPAGSLKHDLMLGFRVSSDGKYRISYSNIYWYAPDFNQNIQAREGSKIHKYIIGAALDYKECIELRI